MRKKGPGNNDPRNMVLWKKNPRKKVRWKKVPGKMIGHFFLILGLIDRNGQIVQLPSLEFSSMLQEPT